MLFEHEHASGHALQQMTADGARLGRQPTEDLGLELGGGRDDSSNVTQASPVPIYVKHVLTNGRFDGLLRCASHRVMRVRAHVYSDNMTVSCK
jgi:hypothetical protein